jgi:hypothetical protein
MKTFGSIIDAVKGAVAIALMIFLGVVAFQVKGEVHDWRVKQAEGDSVRAVNEIVALQGRVALLDQNAARTRTVFVQARDQQTKQPIVTGGGKKADSIANAAVNACFAKATAALTACETARKTADSLPALKDSLTAARIKLAGLREPPRWTAKGFVGYAWPMKKPALGVSSDFKIPVINLNATADADYLIMGSPTTALDSAIAKQKWRVKVGASIPFR